MLSAKKLFSLVLILLLVAGITFVPAWHGISIARYVFYAAVFLGAVITIFGSFAAMLGKIDNDLKK